MVNYLAILVTAIVAMVIGSLWYGPLFGKLWIKLMGFSDKQVKEMQKQKKKMMWSYLGMFVGSLLTAYVLSYFIGLTGVWTASVGITLALWAWLGFFLPLNAGMMFWDNKSPKLFFLVTAYWLLTLVITGAILGSWA